MIYTAALLRICRTSSRSTILLNATVREKEEFEDFHFTKYLLCHSGWHKFPSMSVLVPFVQNKMLHSVHLGTFCSRFWLLVLLMASDRWLTALDCQTRFHFPWSQLIISLLLSLSSLWFIKGCFRHFRLELRKKRQTILCLLEMKQQQHFLLDERSLFNWVGTLVCIVYQENDHASCWWL